MPSLVLIIRTTVREAKLPIHVHSAECINKITQVCWPGPQCWGRAGSLFHLKSPTHPAKRQTPLRNLNGPLVMQPLWLCCIQPCLLIPGQQKRYTWEAQTHHGLQGRQSLAEPQRVSPHVLSVATMRCWQGTRGEEGKPPLGCDSTHWSYQRVGREEEARPCLRE